MALTEIKNTRLPIHFVTYVLSNYHISPDALFIHIHMSHSTAVKHIFLFKSKLILNSTIKLQIKI